MSNIYIKDLKIIQFYPNPAVDHVQIVIGSAFYGELELSIFDQIGKEKQFNTLSIDKGVSTLTIPVNELLQGYYILNLKTVDGKYHAQKQFVK